VTGDIAVGEEGASRGLVEREDLVGVDFANQQDGPRPEGRCHEQEGQKTDDEADAHAVLTSRRP
jgi:hypothetical protein